MRAFFISLWMKSGSFGCQDFLRFFRKTKAAIDFLVHLFGNNKNNSVKNKILALALIFICNLTSYSQEDNSRLFIDDMLLLAGNFAQPAAEGVGYQSSAGWFSSAVSLDEWDFRFSVQGNALFIPEGQKKYTLRQDQLKLLQIQGASSAELPTAFGGASDVAFGGTINLGIISYELDPPLEAFEGVNRSYVPSAFAQVAVGLPYETELIVRATPKVTIDDVAASTYGIGLKHGLNQYFGPADEEDLHLALGVAYSKFDVEYEFSPIGEQDFLLMNLVQVDADLFLAEIVGSKRWDYFEPFAAIGIIDSNFNYELGGSGTLLPMVNSEIGTLADAQTKVKADFGFNFHYGDFRFSTMATVGDFFNANLGLYIRI